MKNKLGIIGAGVMGQAILNCVINKNFLSKNEIGIYEILEEKLHKLNQDGYKTYDSANKLANDSEFILISIKPQQFELLAADMKINDETTIISIMAGIKSETILNKIKGAVSVARVMPNTPCRIGKGVCAISFNNVENKNQDFIRNLLGCCGIVVDVEENLFDAVTSVSGSGPAYVYMFIEGMIEGGLDGGLSYEQSKKLAVNTVIGAANMVNLSEESTAILTERVCSKGGTTIEAVNMYKEKGLKETIKSGIAACRKRSEEISRSI